MYVWQTCCTYSVRDLKGQWRESYLTPRIAHGHEVNTLPALLRARYVIL